MKLETERLYLRSPEVKDAQAYTAIHNSEFVLRFNAMNPTTAERVAAKCKEPDYLENTVFLEEKNTGRLIGAVFIDEDSLRYGVASKDLSYFLAESHARQGYMKEALRAVIAWLFATKDLECVSARAFSPNTASRALLRSVGFQENGFLPRCVKGYGDVIFDDVLHTLFKEDFR